MALHALSENFKSFSGRLNPSTTTEQTAAGLYAAVKGLIEDRQGPAGPIAPVCFLQGSYRQQTAIHTLHDVDIVALCGLWQPGSTADSGRSWSRDDIFAAIASAITKNSQFSAVIHYGPNSMCVKLKTAMRVEVLPVVHKTGSNDNADEPFRLFRPTPGQWEDGFARRHQEWLTWKNHASKTNGNFIPAVKVLKHIRSLFGQNAVSFHLECLLFVLPDTIFLGGPADYIPAFLSRIEAASAEEWYRTVLKTPCADRDIFVTAEWPLAGWQTFHAFLKKCATVARSARDAGNREDAIRAWQALLGDAYFPHL